MADVPPDADASGGPDRRSEPGMPRWVKVGIIVLVVVVLLVVILTLTGLHEPRPGPGHVP
jgi:hypothetical protein